MDTEVQSKFNKLSLLYQQAESQLLLAGGVRQVTKRTTGRARQRSVDVLGALRERRGPSAAALVRLAYVRALRSAQPGARMTADQEKEVAFFAGRMDRELKGVERTALVVFDNHLRRMSLAQWARETGRTEQFISSLTATDTPFPLEQLARAKVRSTVAMVEMAGALAGTPNVTMDQDNAQ